MSTKIVSKQTGNLVSGSTTTTKKGSPPEVHIEDVDTAGVSVGLSEVGLRVGKTYNLGNFESLKVEVSIKVPCANTEEGLDTAYGFCDGWVSKKLTEVEDEVLAQGGA